MPDFLADRLVARFQPTLAVKRVPNPCRHPARAVVQELPQIIWQAVK